MADILGKYTQMSVLQAEDGMAVEENTVYLIPPKKNITYHSPGAHKKVIPEITNMASVRRDW